MSKKLNTQIKRKGLSMKKSDKKQASLLFSANKKKKSKIRNNKCVSARSLKNMTMSHINKLYKSIQKENLNFEFDCKILVPELGRKMIKITSINKKPPPKDLFFYQSRNNKTKDIWFPLQEDYISQISKKIKKAENRYLYNNINNFNTQIRNENKFYNPKNNQLYLSKYGRFINKENIIISKMLFEGFKCKK